MGEVWRGRDTRLGRDVAIKILPADLAENAQFKVRFEREARTISSLNHPNICTLFDVGESAVTRGAKSSTLHYLVMELIDGESLADRLTKGPLPLAEVLRYGAQIADALHRAHRQGITHRDLKPGNIMITKGGAKLLDFGLARSAGETGAGGANTALPTEAKPLTQEGVIVGTFQYMAPEQLEALEADARTDIFALGAVLYEMATGRRAFQGKTRTSLIAAIVSGNPQPIGEIVPLTPPALEHVVRKCLAKDPDERWQSAHDIADQLRWISEAGSRAGEAAPVIARRRTKLHWAWGLHAVTALVAIAATFGAVWMTREKPRIVRASLLAPEKTSVDFESGAMSVSPDGTKLAFVARGADGTARLWIRSLSALTAQPLAGTDGARFPFWSPDSRYIGFYSDGKLRKIDSSGGPPQAICDGPDGRGGSWSPDGKTILFTPTTRDPLFSVSAAGGVPVAVTKLAADETSHRFPVFMPDGEHFIYLCESGAETAPAVEGFLLLGGKLGTTERKIVAGSNAGARYSRTGHLLYLRDRTLVAQRFDPKSLEAKGEAKPVAEDVVRTARYEAVFSVSDTGLLVFQAGDAGGRSQLVWIDREGRELGTVGKPADYREIALSHDARRVATTIRDARYQKTDIWVIDVERGVSTRLTFGADDEWTPTWSHDDRQIFFTDGNVGRGDIFRKEASGTGAGKPVFATPEHDQIRSISGDGRVAAIMVNNVRTRTGWDITIVDLTTGKGVPLIATPFLDVLPALSTDGRWLAYASNESGRMEVYVQSLGDASGKWQISTDGGTLPNWTKGDREIVFYALDGKLMAVDVTTIPEFSAGVPTPLFAPKRRDILGRQITATSDGSRFLVNRSSDEAALMPMTLVENWPAAIPE